MRIALIGTYPPTRCGIATFTCDVHTSLQDIGVDVDVIRVLPPEECSASISPANGSGPSMLAGRDTYAEVAHLLNDGDHDAVLIEHEFGFFGGVAGSDLLELTTRLEIPYVVTFHTVLPSFADEQASVMRSLCDGAAAITVFTSTAMELMLAQRLVRRSRVRIVGHGAPMEMYFPNPDREVMRRRLGVTPSQCVVSTFGLLSEGKGIEVGIQAIAELPGGLSDVTYVVAGRTHPGVLKRDGEQYRQHLVDMLDDGAGILVPFGDSRALAAGLAGLLVDPDRSCALAAARRTADGLSWPAIGAVLAALLLEAVARGSRPASTPVTSSGAVSRTDPAFV